jgi:hypothetical protein
MAANTDYQTFNRDYGWVMWLVLGVISLAALIMSIYIVATRENSAIVRPPLGTSSHMTSSANQLGLPPENVISTINLTEAMVLDEDGLPQAEGLTLTMDPDQETGNSISEKMDTLSLLPEGIVARCGLIDDMPTVGYAPFVVERHIGTLVAGTATQAYQLPVPANIVAIGDTLIVNVQFSNDNAPELNTVALATTLVITVTDDFNVPVVFGESNNVQSPEGDLNHNSGNITIRFTPTDPQSGVHIFEDNHQTSSTSVVPRYPRSCLHKLDISKQWLISIAVPMMEVTQAPFKISAIDISVQQANSSNLRILN